MPKISPMDVYKLLPGTNCKECGESSCMAFASLLMERKKEVDDCPILSEEKYKGKKEKLIDLLSPPVREVTIGTGERAARIGGEEVIYRHELTFFNQTAFAIDIHDEMSEKEIGRRLEEIEAFSFEVMGTELKLDAVAIRSKSGDAAKFGEAVLAAVEKTELPLVLCSYDPELLEVGLEIALDRKPLIFAATEENVAPVAALASRHRCPVVASAPGDIKALMQLSRKLMDAGIEDIVLDIGTYPSGHAFTEMLDNLDILRRLAVESGLEEARFPLIGVPMTAFLNTMDRVEGTFNEAVLATTQLLNHCDILLLHSMEIWGLLPLLNLRNNIYTDPRKPVSVEPGIYVIGSPDKDSPVCMTSNFALTYYTVAGDVESSGTSCNVLVVDTEGLAVEPAMAGNKLTPEVVKEAITSSKIGEKVGHKKLIIPGMAARIAGDIEEKTGWEVLVGPLDSSDVPAYIEERWGKG